MRGFYAALKTANDEIKTKTGDGAGSNRKMFDDSNNVGDTVALPKFYKLTNGKVTGL